MVKISQKILRAIGPLVLKTEGGALVLETEGPHFLFQGQVCFYNICLYHSYQYEPTFFFFEPLALPNFNDNWHEGPPYFNSCNLSVLPYLII